MMRSILALPVVAVFALSLLSCGAPPGVDRGGDFADLPAEGWAYGDTLAFEPSPAPDSCLSDARVAVAVRHTSGYLYSNLWLEVSTPLAEGDSMLADTVSVELADEYGKWHGRGVGVSFVVTDTLPGRRIYRPGRPAYVRHVMRVDTLADIEQVGLIYFDIKPLAAPQSDNDKAPADTVIK